MTTMTTMPDFGAAAVPSRRARIAIAVAVALAAGALSLVWSAKLPDLVSDFDHLWYAARVAVHGGNPYAVIGPGRAFDYAWVEHYPAPAILLVAAIAAWLPLLATRAAFIGLSSGALAYGATRDGYGRLPLFLSGSFFMAVTATQWSPLITAMALCPALAALAIAKPNLGAAVTLAPLDRRAVIAAVVGGVVLGAASLVFIPGWPAAWLANVRGTGHFVAPIRHAAGPLLLALLRWRRPEARLLLAMACVPHTTMVYETLELFVVARRRVETMLLALLSWVAWVSQIFLNPRVPLGPGGSLMTDPRYAAYVHDVGDVTLALMYLPCLIIVLRRPNEGAVPAWLARAARGGEALVRPLLTRARAARPGA